MTVVFVDNKDSNAVWYKCVYFVPEIADFKYTSLSEHLLMPAATTESQP